MKVESTKTEFGKKIDLIENNNIFTMLFGGNGDLYWSIKNLDNKEKLFNEKFIITKENYFIYSLFETLYDDIVNCNIFKQENDLYYSYVNGVYYNHLNDIVRESRAYHDLYDGNSITWVSDDRDLSFISSVKISMFQDYFLIEFMKEKQNVNSLGFLSYYEPFRISIRFRNSGSSYDYFNVLFMNMYNSLCNYDENYHQIHIEEYLYKVRKREK